MDLNFLHFNSNCLSLTFNSTFSLGKLLIKSLINLAGTVILPFSLIFPEIQQLIPISKLVEDIFNLLFSIDNKILFNIGNVKFYQLFFQLYLMLFFKFS